MVKLESFTFGTESESEKESKQSSKKKMANETASYTKYIMHCVICTQ